MLRHLPEGAEKRRTYAVLPPSRIGLCADAQRHCDSGAFACGPDVSVGDRCGGSSAAGQPLGLLGGCERFCATPYRRDQPKLPPCGSLALNRSLGTRLWGSTNCVDGGCGFFRLTTNPGSGPNSSCPSCPRWRHHRRKGSGKSHWVPV